MLWEGENSKSKREDPKMIKKSEEEFEIPKTFYQIVFSVKSNVTLVL